MTENNWWKKLINRKWGREWLKVAAGICLLLLAGVYFFIHEPLMAMEHEARAAAEKSRMDLVAVDNYQNAHLDMAAYEKELLEHQAHADRALPDTMEQGRFLGVLQQEALREHIELKQVVPKAVQREDNLSILPIEVKMRCSYFALLAFLQGLQRCDRYIQVERTAIHVEAGALNCTLSLRIYAWNETKDSGNEE